MKKMIVAASLLAACFGAYAQDYKPVAGDVTAELGLFANGFNANPTSLPSSGVPDPSTGAVFPQLKFRYFLADQLAIRAGVNIAKSGHTDKIYEPAATGSGTGFARYSSSTVLINAGIEKHFSGTERLSTYAGADITMLSKGAAEKWENTADGVNFTDGAGRKTVGSNTNGDTGAFGFGARLVAGADYYFVEKVYLGGEFGWGFLATKESRVKDEVTDAAGVTTTTETKSAAKDFNLGTLVTAGFRLGYRF